MGILEIVLIILGLAIFILSFAIPEKKEKMLQDKIEMTENLISELVDEQLDVVADKLEEVMDDKKEEHIERIERRLERLTNEKILAVGEYSDTVLEDIKKNHDEVVFLYDMLNNKHKSLNELVSKVETLKKENITENLDSMETADKKNKTGKSNGTGKLPKTSVMGKDKAVESNEIPEQNFAPLKPETVSIRREHKAVNEGMESVKNTTLQFSKKNSEGPNNNERILELHKEGKTNMIIAKELGLGVGEVKLVIDLFQEG